MRRLPPLNALRAFEAAGRHESFTAAAREMNVSHAAISRHVRGLEARLGVTLFRIMPRGVALTEAGARYLLEITAALDRIEQATERLTRAEKTRLMINAEPTFAMKWLMLKLPDFNALHPEIETYTESSNAPVNLALGEADIAIRWMRNGEPPDGLASSLISLHRVTPVASPALAAEIRREPLPDALLNAPHLHEDDGTLWRRWLKAAGLSDQVVTEGDSRRKVSSLMAYEGALVGRGVALLAVEMVAEDIASGRLVRLGSHLVEYGRFYLCTTKEAAHRGAVSTFREWLLEKTRSFRGGGISEPE